MLIFATSMKTRVIGCLVALFSCLGIYAQGIPRLTDRSMVSVLTCGAGEELYSTFGHSAFRVQDPVLGIDVVYNYGTFNFNTPNFYLKFARGKLLYSLSRERFENFLYSYEMEERWVKEQVLDLDLDQRNALFQFLEHNNLPENRDYKYDFLFDNCATKIRDVLQKVFGDQLQFYDNHLRESYTFRQLIHQNLKTNSWSAFGIDLALGAVVDRKATPLQYTFLPNYVLQQLDHTELKGSPLVQRTRVVLDATPVNSEGFFMASPLFWILMLMLLAISITYIDFKNGTRSRWLDFFLFFLTGGAGIFLFFLWFLTDHTATAWNLNILWAFPVNLFFAFQTMRRNKLPHNFELYLLGLLILLGLVPVLWITGIQRFTPVILPILLLLALRYAYLLWAIKKNKLI